MSSDGSSPAIIHRDAVRTAERAFSSPAGRTRVHRLLRWYESKNALDLRLAQDSVDVFRNGVAQGCETSLICT